jgi:hypothetical protein
MIYTTAEIYNRLKKAGLITDDMLTTDKGMVKIRPKAKTKLPDGVLMLEVDDV